MLDSKTKLTKVTFTFQIKQEVQNHKISVGLGKAQSICGKMYTFSECYTLRHSIKLLDKRGILTEGRVSFKYGVKSLVERSRNPRVSGAGACKC